MTDAHVYIAKCPEHGFIGTRTVKSYEGPPENCRALGCGRPTEQVPMIPATVSEEMVERLRDAVQKALLAYDLLSEDVERKSAVTDEADLQAKEAERVLDMGSPRLKYGEVQETHKPPDSPTPMEDDAAAWIAAAKSDAPSEPMVPASELDLRAVDAAVKEADGMLALGHGMGDVEAFVTRVCIAYEEGRSHD